MKVLRGTQNSSLTLRCTCPDSRQDIWPVKFVLHNPPVSWSFAHVLALADMRHGNRIQNVPLFCSVGWTEAFEGKDFLFPRYRPLSSQMIYIQWTQSLSYHVISITNVGKTVFLPHNLLPTFSTLGSSYPDQAMLIKIITTLTLHISYIGLNRIPSLILW